MNPAVSSTVCLSARRNSEYCWTAADARGGMGWWLAIVCFLLAGYALLGRGFAYLGVHPLYMGELVLALGLLSLLLGKQWYVWLYSPCAWLLIFLCVWGGMQTIPYLPEYNVDALRDAVLYGYSLYAVVVMAHVVTRPQSLPSLVTAYSRFTLPLAALPLPIWYIEHIYLDALPMLPWAPDVPILSVKGGDVLVHLAGVLAFWVAYPIQSYGRAVRVVGLLAVGAGAVAVGSETRSGLLAFLLVLALCVAAYHRESTLRSMLGTGITLLVLLAMAGTKLSMGEREREISVDQVIDNVLSIAAGDGEEELHATKQWRIDWWNEIVDYAMFGKYAWTGKGFGVNLADDDGFQIYSEDDGAPLRSPHNGHLTMLARAGLPGILLWSAALGVWAATIVRSFWQARKQEHRRWEGLFFVLFCYATAIFVQASFDVYLEGPVGGIWFWVVYGVGISAAWLYRWMPDLLDDAEVPA